jgi:hypothetical protein
MSGVFTKSLNLLHRHLWWLAPVVIIMPLVYFSGNAVAPSAAYFGTTGIWNVISKLVDQI